MAEAKNADAARDVATGQPCAPPPEPTCWEVLETVISTDNVDRLKARYSATDVRESAASEKLWDGLARTVPLAERSKIIATESSAGLRERIMKTKNDV